MRLLTLGGLKLSQDSFSRPKPLSLLTYLALEGPQDRGHLAELFFEPGPRARSNLSMTLTRLRKVIPKAIDADELRVWTSIEIDTQAFLNAVQHRKWQKALELYEGPFLAGLLLSDAKAEFEEWRYEKREHFASHVQEALLQVAEGEAAKGNFIEAAKKAEEAYLLQGAPTPEPEELNRFYTLLCAGGSPLIKEVSKEANSFDIKLSLSNENAQTRLRCLFINRKRELEQINNLSLGQWAWIRGGAGIGKTSLLKHLEGTYIPARSGLPYATLESQLGSSINEGEETMLRCLMKLRGTYLIDGWETMDSESQNLIKRLRGLQPNLLMIISSRKEAALDVDLFLELGVIPKEEVESYEEIWQKAEGVPALMGALLRGENVETTLEACLSSFTAIPQEVYCSLALLDDSDPAFVRQALKIEAKDMAKALEELIAAGLITPAGQVRARRIARDYLNAKPSLLSKLALQLARQLKGIKAFSLYQAARVLWSEEDFRGLQEAYVAWASEVLKRGFPQRAAEVLEELPTLDSYEVACLKARALERAGQFHQSLNVIRNFPEDSEILALKATLYWRLGQPKKAKELAEGVLEGSMEARAEALTALGHLARDIGNYKEAIRCFKKATALWKAQNNHMRCVESLSNQGLALGEEGENYIEAEITLKNALEAAGENPIMQGRVLNNLGLFVYIKQNNFAQAEEVYQQCISLHEEVNLLDTACRAWNNLGYTYELQKQFTKAKGAYEKALILAQQSGDQRMIGFAMANVAEITGDQEAWEEGLHVLSKAGQIADVKLFRADEPFKSRQVVNKRSHVS